VSRDVIRGLFAPALVAILGRWNWWLPARPARILRVEASPVHAEPATQTA
jgi:RND superfamily putative drug exporter